mgnify:FL=1
MKQETDGSIEKGKDRVHVTRKGYRMKKKNIRSAILLCLAFCILFQGARMQQAKSDKQNVTTNINKMETGLYAGACAEFERTELATVKANQKLLVAAALESENALQEENVYSFLQGPKSWESRLPWSGEWCLKYVKGHYFGGFGCGLVCMANIYSTLTDYTCSPYDMFEYATQVTGYYPSKKSGAIGWGEMKVTLQKCGFDCDLYYKPETYEAFQSQIKEAQTAIVLVSSYNDDTFWKKTSGHYVNIWLYNEETDEVFLTEPGGPEKNRTWVPLRYIYDALKTSSQYQYLRVDSYDEANNTWLHNGIENEWVAP